MDPFNYPANSLRGPPKSDCLRYNCRAFGATMLILASGRVIVVAITLKDITNLIV